MNKPVVLGTPPTLSHRPVIMGDRGIVVAGHHRAAEAGAAMLRAGGNAMDAAIATAATLAVAIPFMNGLGGDCMALYSRHPEDVTVVNGSGATAKKATVAELRSRGFRSMPERGPLTVSVPGFVAAIGQAAERFATLPFARLLEPAIALAEEGVPIDASAAVFFNGPVYAALAAEFPMLQAAFGKPGGWTLGYRLKQPAAALTLRNIVSNGWRAFYSGSMAEAWLAAARASGVFLDAGDLASHGTEFTRPLSVAWNGKTVYAAPPNSQGLALLAMLGIAQAQHLSPPRTGPDPLIDPIGHLDVKMRAFELRDAYCTDPRRVALPPGILSARHLSKIAAGNDAPAAVRGGGGDTSTFVVIDKDGHAISWVQSLFAEFGSGIVCPDHGIVLHNRAALQTLDDDPIHGFKGGYRPFHTLCPALVAGPDGAAAAIATPGDHGQPQTLALVLRRHFEQGLDIQAAIEWPRMRHDSGREVMLEDRCPAAWDAMLTSAGFSVRHVGPWSRLMGGVNAIVRRSDGLLMGGADPRRSSYAVCA
jgi:gamma-glutamyltranspeptidase / glutathione hydrolase